MRGTTAFAALSISHVIGQTLNEGEVRTIDDEFLVGFATDQTVCEDDFATLSSSLDDHLKTLDTGKVLPKVSVENAVDLLKVRG